MIARTDDCSDEPCRFVRTASSDLSRKSDPILSELSGLPKSSMMQLISGPREAATNDPTATNKWFHPRSRFSGLAVANRPRDRGEPSRSYGPTPDTHARLFLWPPSAEREPTCGPLTLTELRPLASATTNGHIQPESILGSPTELLGRLNCSDNWIARTIGLLGRILPICAVWRNRLCFTDRRST